MKTKPFRYALETLLAYFLYAFFRIFPVEIASGLGGWIGRGIGPRLKSSDTARRNLALAFPDKREEEREAILNGMWDNIGRTMAEYAHLHHIWNRVELVGAEYLALARNSGKPSLFFAAHLANWEICPISARKTGLEIHTIYRRPNNAGVEKLLQYARGAGAAGLIPKGPKGAKEMLAVMKKNGALGILMDQKLNEGVAISFFGREAMTAPAIALFALKFDCPVYPVRIERLKGVRFKMTVYPPLERKTDAQSILTEINQAMEGWIRERPEQWLWTHRRWPD